MNKVSVLWCFSTNRTHALDLCLVFMSRTHFEQVWGNRSPNFYKWKFWICNSDAHWTRCHQLPLLMLHFKTLVWHFIPTSWYMCITLTCFLGNLKCTKTTLRLKYWNVTCLWYFEIECCIEVVPYTYTYACGKNIFIGNHID
jgi:hypothetical protein